MMHRSLAIVITALLAVALVVADPAGAATPPPAASRLVTHPGDVGSIGPDHSIDLSYAVPSAAFDPGAKVVVRYTRGYTPAATPTQGYAAQDNLEPLEHQARAPNAPFYTPLTADTPYTFAVWIYDHGLYSKRAYVTGRTAKDTTPPSPADSLQARASLVGAASPRVLVTWNDFDNNDDDNAARVVRNTTPDFSSGTVFMVDAGAYQARSFVDNDLPGAVTVSGQGFSTQPVYYWVRPRDRSGNYAQSYQRVSVVVGSSSIAGSVSGSGRTVELFAVTGNGPVSVTASSRSGPGSFTFRVPHGRYAVCSRSTSGAANGRCWTGSATTPWDGRTADVPSFVVSGDSYQGVSV